MKYVARLNHNVHWSNILSIYLFFIPNKDCRAQYVDTQFADQTNHIHAILCAYQ